MHDVLFLFGANIGTIFYNQILFADFLSRIAEIIRIESVYSPSKAKPSSIMAAKEKTVYVCTNCGQESPKWAGKCPACGQWNTFVEEVQRKETPMAKHPAHGIESVRTKPLRLREVLGSEDPRINLGDDELNRVLGTGAGLSDPDRGRTGHRQINAGPPDCIASGQTEGAVCIGRGKHPAAQAPRRPYSPLRIGQPAHCL